MTRKRDKRKSGCKKSKNIHKKINALKTFFEILQLLKAIIEFFY